MLRKYETHCLLNRQRTAKGKGFRTEGRDGGVGKRSAWPAVGEVHKAQEQGEDGGQGG